MPSCFNLYPFQVGDVIRMKKQHPCGGWTWEIVRTGADISLKCLTCGHQVVIPRRKLEKAVKTVLSEGKERTGNE
jgi:hypothetical protein